MDRYATSPEGLGRFMRTLRICNQMKRGPKIGLAVGKSPGVVLHILERDCIRGLAELIQSPRDCLVKLVG